MRIVLLFILIVFVNIMAYGQTSTIWGSNCIPESSGLMKSKEFDGITFTGRHVSYTGADTWYMIYAKDGTIYSSWTDGSVNDIHGGSPNPRCGKILGSDPLSLDVSVVGDFVLHPGKGGKFNFGRYPCAQLMYNDIWYYGTYLLEQNDRSTYMPHTDWPVLQPFIGFRVSDNFAQTWYDKTNPDDPIFENAHDKFINSHNVKFNGKEIMVGAPHFVDFGDNMKYAPVDQTTGRKWAYMVTHGADPGVDIAENSWISGDNIYLLRILMPEGKDVEKNFEYMNNPSNWQYFTKAGDYMAWNRDNLEEVYKNIAPILHSTGYLGNVGMVYDAPLKKYIMTLSHCDKADSFHTIILESDKITGNYNVIEYLDKFATVSYFMNIPSRFISEDGKTMWLCFSSNYYRQQSNLEDSRYALCLMEFSLGTSSNKYECESMKCLGTASYETDSMASNSYVINNISHRTDGVEFYSKNSATKIGISVKTPFKKQVSVFVNDKFITKVIFNPSDKYVLNYGSLDIKQGDKITIKVDENDVLFNRLEGGVNKDGSINFDTSYHMIGRMDYVVLE